MPIIRMSPEKSNDGPIVKKNPYRRILYIKIIKLVIKQRTPKLPNTCDGFVE